MTAPAIPSAEPHVAAVKARLVAALPTSVKVAVGRAPQGVPPPYVVIYPDAGDVHAARLSGDRAHIVIHLLLHAIGTGADQAGWTADRAREVLLGSPPTVVGRKVYRLTQTLGSAPLTRDDDVNPPLFLQVAEYRLTSDPA